MADISDPNYETVSATCDVCGAACVFSRIDDIGDINPISGKRVSCFSCGGQFWIKGDTVNTAYQFLIDDAREHFALKRYMPAIAGVAQAWEVFFATCALSTFAYRPFFASPGVDQDVDDLNRLYRTVRAATEKFTWFPMRNVAMNMLIHDPRPTTIPEADAAIGQLAAFGNEPSAKAISQLADFGVRDLADRLATLSVGALRNDVVHKHAYRPNRTQVEPCLTSEISLLYRVKHHLGVGDFLEHQAGAVYEARSSSRALNDS